MIKKRFAFTMMELIFVIVVMGILGTFGVEFLAQSYNNYIVTKINDDLQSRSAASVEFISKRLEYRIKKSARLQNTSEGNPPRYLHGGARDDNADILEWIASDIDSFRGDALPLWSGLLDLNSSTGTTLVSPGSDFSEVNRTIAALSNDTSTVNNAALYFIDSYLDVNGTDNFSFYSATNKTMHPVNGISDTQLSANLSGMEVSEYYKLSWTANAVKFDSDTGDLWFYFNYQPWEGETYTQGTKVLLAEDISAFRFRSAASMIKIQVCTKTDLLENEEYALCKEKTVF